jgi:hypothetical protein
MTKNERLLNVRLMLEKHWFTDGKSAEYTLFGKEVKQVADALKSAGY